MLKNKVIKPKEYKKINKLKKYKKQ